MSEEKKLLEQSEKFWTAMEKADEAGMREISDPNCHFVHIGVTAPLDEEIEFYTSGKFQPTNLDFHDKKAYVFDDTGVVLTDCDYGLLLDGKPTTHHFAVTETFNKKDGEWKLVNFTFTPLVY